MKFWALQIDVLKTKALAHCALHPPTLVRCRAVCPLALSAPERKMRRDLEEVCLTNGRHNSGIGKKGSGNFAFCMGFKLDLILTSMQSLSTCQRSRRLSFVLSCFGGNI